MKKVLIIEDDESIQDMLALYLNTYVELRQAYTIAEARAAFENGQNGYAIVTFDGLVPRAKDGAKNLQDMLGLVRELRPLTAGTFIAASSMSGFREQLRAAGCDREVLNKGDLPRTIRALLQLQ